MASMFFSTLTEIHSELVEMRTAIECLHAIDKAVEVTALGAVQLPSAKSPEGGYLSGPFLFASFTKRRSKP
jgi:hypothetical protein